MNKKVLIITYYWPPAGGPGVQRWLKFTTYLSQFGITPVVYIPENPSYPITDNALVNEAPDIEIIKLPISEPYKWAKMLFKKKTNTVSRGIISSQQQGIVERLLLFIRGNYFIPDARKSWVKPSVKFLSSYLKKHHIDVIITTGPPHSMHLIGMALNNQTQIPWIADFRDPWTTIGYHSKLKLSKTAAKKHKQLEHHVLNSADHILVTSPTTKKEFKVLTKKPITVITNGFDSTLNRVEAASLDTQFSLAHIGSLLAERNPRLLWEVLEELCAEIEGFKNNLLLHFVGYVAPDITKSLEQYGLTSNCKFSGYVAHNEALQWQVRSQVLLVIEIDTPETRCIIPGKLFEYFMAGRPILAIGPKGSDIKGLIDKTNTGAFFNYSQKEELKNNLVNVYSAYKNNTLTVEPKNINAFDRKTLTAALAEVIERTNQ